MSRDGGQQEFLKRRKMKERGLTQDHIKEDLEPDKLPRDFHNRNPHK